jgi:hypothetical protein
MRTSGGGENTQIGERTLGDNYGLLTMQRLAWTAIIPPRGGKYCFPKAAIQLAQDLREYRHAL